MENEFKIDATEDLAISTDSYIYVAFRFPNRQRLTPDPLKCFLCEEDFQQNERLCLVVSRVDETSMEAQLCHIDCRVL